MVGWLRHAEGHRFKKMATPVARREAAAHLREVHAVSQRRPCRRRRQFQPSPAEAGQEFVSPHPGHPALTFDLSENIRGGILHGQLQFHQER